MPADALEESQGQLGLNAPPTAPATERIELEREALLDALAGNRGDTLVHRVAIVLNRYPDTRDSDITLMLRYWELYEDYGGGPIDPAELFHRARLTSLSRARARVQNTYRLFQASPEIRRRRGKLSEEEHSKALEATERYPGLTVLVDESGKTGKHLIVGAVWFSDPEEFFVLTRKLGEWRLRAPFDREVHFKELDESVEDYYKQALDIVLTEGASVSFKAVSVPREGLKRVDEALEELMYQLLRRGIEHEDQTGRATLPRAIQVWKDLEAKGADKILLARLKDRVEQAGRVEFAGKLTTDNFEVVESHKSYLMQIADLFAGSLNRVLNAPGGGQHVKDRFARYLLQQVGMPDGPTGEQQLSDAVMHIQL